MMEEGGVPVEDQQKDEPDKRSRWTRAKNWLHSPACFICINFFLSQWGDWMWQFAVGLYLYELSNKQLLLSAIYGFTGGGLILLFGGVIGDWVDRNERLKVVRISLFTQNFSVAVSCVAVCLRLVDSLTADTRVTILLEAVVILTAIVAQLASVAYKIAIEKDWIVVIAAGSNSKLANLNAFSRAIDLTCKVLSPTVCGFIMAYASMRDSAIALAAWNLFSVFIEYGLLAFIYRRVPRLAAKNTMQTKPDDIEQEMEIMISETPRPPGDTPRPPGDSDTPRPPGDSFKANSESEAREQQEQQPIDSIVDTHYEPETPGLIKEGQHKYDELEMPTETKALTGHHKYCESEVPVEDKPLKPQLGEKELITGIGSRGDEKEVNNEHKRRCCLALIEPIFVLIKAWRTYAKQPVVFASLALALLYMTVLGFDSITTGYIYANDVSEYIVGISMALAGVTGLIGTILFTRLRRRIGLERTGLIAFNTEITFLVLAVVSIWAPGSKFDPSFGQKPTCNTTVGNYSDFWSTSSADNSTWVLGMSDYATAASKNNVTTSSDGGGSSSAVNVSIILLLVGIILSRVGLWMADLVVTQLMQESVIESERGIVNGVQNSLNMLMDMLKFALVIALPQIEIFGIHILVSFTFICAACALYAYHSWRVRGHLFHFGRIKQCCRKSQTVDNVRD